MTESNLIEPDKVIEQVLAYCSGSPWPKERKLSMFRHCWFSRGEWIRHYYEHIRRWTPRQIYIHNKENPRCPHEYLIGVLMAEFVSMRIMGEYTQEFNEEFWDRKFNGSYKQIEIRFK